MLAVFNVKGFLLEALASFFKGLLGFGAYVLPFALLVVCGTILFARGKPVAGRIVTTMLIPVMVGVLAHLLFADVALDQHVVPALYRTGKTWHSGGVIAGGIGALLSAALSNVGALIISFILFTYLLLRFINIKLRTILEFFIGVHERLSFAARRSISTTRRLKRTKSRSARLSRRCRRNGRNRRVWSLRASRRSRNTAAAKLICPWRPKRLSRQREACRGPCARRRTRVRSLNL